MKRTTGKKKQSAGMSNRFQVKNKEYCLLKDALTGSSKYLITL